MQVLREEGVIHEAVQKLSDKNVKREARSMGDSSAGDVLNSLPLSQKTSGQVIRNNLF